MQHRAEHVGGRDGVGAESGGDRHQGQQGEEQTRRQQPGAGAPGAGGGGAVRPAVSAGTVMRPARRRKSWCTTDANTRSVRGP